MIYLRFVTRLISDAVWSKSKMEKRQKVKNWIQNSMEFVLKWRFCGKFTEILKIKPIMKKFATSLHLKNSFNLTQYFCKILQSTAKIIFLLKLQYICIKKAQLHSSFINQNIQTNPSNRHQKLNDFTNTTKASKSFQSDSFSPFLFSVRNRRNRNTQKNERKKS